MKADLQRGEGEREREEEKEEGRRAQARERENKNLDRKRNAEAHSEIYIYIYLYKSRKKENAAKKQECNTEKARGGGLGWAREEKKVGRPCQADCSRAMSQKQA